MKRRTGTTQPGRTAAKRAGQLRRLDQIVFLQLGQDEASWRLQTRKVRVSLRTFGRMPMSLFDVVRTLPTSQKAMLLGMLARDLRAGYGHPGIDRTPGVCGGSARIVRTRVPVWALEQARRVGFSEADILRSYPNLRAQDLVHAWSYATSHPDEISREIRDNEEA